MILFLAALLWMAGPGARLAAANSEAYFSPGGDIQKKLVAAIEQTRTSIDIAMFELSARPLLRALQQAGERGVTVRLILDARTFQENPHDRILGKAENVSLRCLSGREPRRGMMHNKFAILDGAQVVTGSYNWTEGAEVANYENALFDDDPDLVQTYSREFETLWSQAAASPPRSVRTRYRRSYKSWKMAD